LAKAESYRRNNPQERFLELWDESRDIHIDRSMDVGGTSDKTAEEVALLDSMLAKRQSSFESRPAGVWDRAREYDCFICENIMSVGPFPSSSDVWMSKLQRERQL
jgi:hypothetical protein